jgi:hypothetical protein
MMNYDKYPQYTNFKYAEHITESENEIFMYFVKGATDSLILLV